MYREYRARTELERDKSVTVVRLFLRTEHVIGTDHETCQEQGLWTESVTQYQNQM